jgi:hypothetical protein
VTLTHFLLDFLVILLFLYHIQWCIFSVMGVGEEFHIGGGVVSGWVGAELEVL